MPKQPWPQESAGEWEPIIRGVIELVKDINALRTTIFDRKPNSELIRLLLPKIKADAAALHHLFGLVKFHYENDRPFGERWPRWVLAGFEIGLNNSDRIRRAMATADRAYQRQGAWSYLEKLTITSFEDALEISRTIITEGGPGPIDSPLDELADIANARFDDDDDRQPF